MWKNYTLTTAGCPAGCPRLRNHWGEQRLAPLRTDSLGRFSWGPVPWSADPSGKHCFNRSGRVSGLGKSSWYVSSENWRPFCLALNVLSVGVSNDGGKISWDGWYQEPCSMPHSAIQAARLIAGVGVTKTICSIPLFSGIFSTVKRRVRYKISR